MKGSGETPKAGDVSKGPALETPRNYFPHLVLNRDHLVTPLRRMSQIRGAHVTGTVVRALALVSGGAGSSPASSTKLL